MADPLVVVTDTGQFTLTPDTHWSLHRNDDGLVVAADLPTSGRLGTFAYIAGWVFEPVPGSSIRIGDRPAHRLVTGLAGTLRLTEHAPLQEPPTTPTPPGRSALPHTVVFGRSGTGADVELVDISVSADHAIGELQPDGRWAIRRGKGQLLVEGRPRALQVLEPGQTFVLGNSVLQVPEDASAAHMWLRTSQPSLGAVEQPPTGVGPPQVLAAPVKVTIRNLSIDRYDDDGSCRRVLADVSCDFLAAHTTAIVGPSGSGKSTLLEAIRGESHVATGRISIDTEIVAAPDRVPVQSSLAAFVPQNDDVHESLTVTQALRFAVGLRSAEDLTENADRDRVAAALLHEVGLTDLSARRVHALSGGELKRLSVAIELPGHASLLCLDEPASGLDPATERELMTHLNELATNGTTVVIVTHSIAALDLCDRVIALDASGKVAYDGPPARGPEALAVTSWPDAFELLATARREPPQTGGRPPRPPFEASASRPWAGTFGVLLRRQVALFTARGRSALMTLAVLPMLGAAVGAFANSDGWTASPDLPKSACLLAVMAALIGVSLTYSDLVNELPLLRRERRIGVTGRLVTWSKFTVAAAVGTLLVAAMVGLYAVFRPIGDPTSPLFPPAWLALGCALVFTCVASSALGLLISACADTLERAVYGYTGLALLFVAFNGVLLELDGTWGWLSAAVPSRPGVAAQIAYLGSAGPPGLNDNDPLWTHSTLVFWWNTLWLATLTVVSTSTAAWVLERRLRRPPTRRRGG